MVPARTNLEAQQMRRRPGRRVMQSDGMMISAGAGPPLLPPRSSSGLLLDTTTPPQHHDHPPRHEDDPPQQPSSNARSPPSDAGTRLSAANWRTTEFCTADSVLEEGAAGAHGGGGRGQATGGLTGIQKLQNVEDVCTAIAGLRTELQQPSVVPMSNGSNEAVASGGPTTSRREALASGTSGSPAPGSSAGAPAALTGGRGGLNPGRAPGAPFQHGGPSGPSTPRNEILSYGAERQVRSGGHVPVPHRSVVPPPGGRPFPGGPLPGGGTAGCVPHLLPAGAGVMPPTVPTTNVVQPSKPPNLHRTMIGNDVAGPGSSMAGGVVPQPQNHVAGARVQPMMRTSGGQQQGVPVVPVQHSVVPPPGRGGPPGGPLLHPAGGIIPPSKNPVLLRYHENPRQTQERFSNGSTSTRELFSSPASDHSSSSVDPRSSARAAASADAGRGTRGRSRVEGRSSPPSEVSRSSCSGERDSVKPNGGPDLSILRTGTGPEYGPAAGKYEWTRKMVGSGAVLCWGRSSDGGGRVEIIANVLVLLS